MFGDPSVLSSLFRVSMLVLQNEQVRPDELNEPNPRVYCFACLRRHGNDLATFVRFKWGVQSEEVDLHTDHHFGLELVLRKFRKRSFAL